MIIEVMNRHTAEKTKFSEDTMVISITDTWTPSANIRHDKVFFFNFDDEESPNPLAMSKSDAIHIGY